MGHSLSGTTAHLRAFTAVAICCLGILPAQASERLQQLAQSVGVSVLTDGTSGSDVQTRSARQLPFQKMSQEAAGRARFIVENTSQFRKMPSLRYQVEPGMYRYLISNPDVAVATWRAMGISQLKMLQTGVFEYQASAPDGSEGTADVLCRDDHQCVFIVQGEYHSPLIPATIKASALVWLQYEFVESAEGKRLVNQHVQTYIHFPSNAVDVIARLASRVTNNILDRNVFEVSLYARMMSQAAERDPEWVRQLASRMDGVLPQRREELAAIALSGRAVPLLPNSAVAADMRMHSRLAASGEFRNFENSLRNLNQHIPLVPQPMAHAETSVASPDVKLRAQSQSVRMQSQGRPETDTSGTRNMQFFSGDSTRSVARATHRQLRQASTVSSADPPPLVFLIESGDPTAGRKPQAQAPGTQARAESSDRRMPEGAAASPVSYDRPLLTQPISASRIKDLSGGQKPSAAEGNRKPQQESYEPAPVPPVLAD